jgi:hypothetical protein
MKWIKSSWLAGLVMMMGFLLAGCASFQKQVVTTDPGSGITTTNQVFDVESITPVIETAAFITASVELPKHPEWRKGFETAITELKEIEAAPKIDINQILAVVGRLPVKELQSQEAKLAIAGGQLLLARYGAQLSRVDSLNRLEDLRPIARAIRTGLENGMPPKTVAGKYGTRRDAKPQAISPPQPFIRDSPARAVS